jgi:hypothetical protein
MDSTRRQKVFIESSSIVKNLKSEKEIDKFKEFIGECTSDQIALIKMKQCLWLWKILSVYKEIHYYPELKGNSRNAKFCELLCTDDNAKETPIFAKVEIEEGVRKCDNMIVDNLNGFVINSICNGSPHFIEYIDSCKTFVKQGRLATTFPIEELNPNLIYSTLNSTIRLDCKENDIILCAIINNKKNLDGCVLKPAKVSFYKLIEGNQNLSDYIYKIYKQKDWVNGQKQLQIMTQSLFMAMKQIGYGFCHNDAHLGNILVTNDNGQETLVLIDYGRVIFTPVPKYFGTFNFSSGI